MLDVGTFQFRAGYSGEDCPRTVIPSLIGLCDAESDIPMDDSVAIKASKYISGSAELNFKRDHMELAPLYSPTTQTLNFDYFGHLLDKTLRELLLVNPEETPLIFTEPAIHNKE